jgi:hypothetical protein
MVLSLANKKGKEGWTQLDFFIFKHSSLLRHVVINSGKSFIAIDLGKSFIAEIAYYHHHMQTLFSKDIQSLASTIKLLQP